MIWCFLFCTNLSPLQPTYGPALPESLTNVAKAPTNEIPGVSFLDPGYQIPDTGISPERGIFIESFDNVGD